MPEKMTLHYKDGSTTSMDAIDARHVLREHSSEWSTSAFPAEVQKEAQAEAAALRDLLANMRADGKNEYEVEKARLAWPDTWKAMKAKAAMPVKAFEAKHRGKGSYSVMTAAGEEVVQGMTKEDAEAFNAMSEAEQADYVASEKKTQD